MKKKKKPDNEIASNRQAFRDYDLIETFEAGIVLVGTEIKSLRDHGGNIRDAFVTIDENEAFLRQASIAPYKFGNIHNHEERRSRKLLLHKYQILKIDMALRTSGCTAVPLAMYFVKGRVKVKFAIAKGRKLHDKREAIKKKEVKKEIEKASKLGR